MKWKCLLVNTNMVSIWKRKKALVSLKSTWIKKWNRTMMLKGQHQEFLTIHKIDKIAMYKKPKIPIGLMDRAINIFYWKIISGKKIMLHITYPALTNHLLNLSFKTWIMLDKLRYKKQILFIMAFWISIKHR